MDSNLRQTLLEALERPHRLGTIGGDLEEQLAHCASFSSVLSQIGLASDARGIDLGTGGGLPGLALAALWPAMHWALVDMRVARATEVERIALGLGLGERTEVHGIEAQRLGHDADFRESFDVAVARAFGPASITTECAAGMVRVGGSFIVSEPPTDDQRAQLDHQTEPRWDYRAVSALGFTEPEMIEMGGSRFAVLTKQSPAPDMVPRLPPRSTRGWVSSSTGS